MLIEICRIFGCSRSMIATSQRSAAAKFSARARMMRLVFSILIAIDISAAFAAETNGLTLYNECNSSDIVFRDTCGSYIFGVLDGIGFAVEKVKFPPPFCPTVTSISRQQLEMIYLQWARSNPQFLNLRRDEAVVAALVTAFPCPPH
jgi:predicted membrane protein